MLRLLPILLLADAPAIAQTTATAAVAVPATAPAAITPVPSLAEFGSLMTDRVEARAAPSAASRVIVIFTRADLPVQLLESAGPWRRVQDQDGTAGWARADLISRRRTALAITGSAGAPGEPIPIRAANQDTANPIALLEPGVLVGLLACDGRFCKVTAQGIRGYVSQGQLWGTTAGEVFK